jgi:hypothetical protein
MKIPSTTICGNRMFSIFFTIFERRRSATRIFHSFDIPVEIISLCFGSIVTHHNQMYSEPSFFNVSSIRYSAIFSLFKDIFEDCIFYPVPYRTWFHLIKQAIFEMFFLMINIRNKNAEYIIHILKVFCFLSS